MSQINFFDEIIVDNFAGGGGASTGIELGNGSIRMNFRRKDFEIYIREY